MKKVLVLIISILCFCTNGFSQDLIKEIQKLTLEKDSLQKEYKLITDNHKEYTLNAQKIILGMKEQIKALRSDSAEVKKVKAERRTFNTQLKTKSDSIANLKKTVSEKDIQIAAVKQESDKNVNAKFQEGKNATLSSIINAYKKPFDDLIRCSTKESVQRDLQVLGSNAEVSQILPDLQIYFSTKELLSKKFNDSRIKDAQGQLNAVKQKSDLLEKLNGNIENYKNYNDGLKETIEKIIELDGKEIAEGSDFVQQQKLNKILFEISEFIFNYDFNFIDYPYLSDIVLEIMKRKQPNADADITDLLNEL